MAQLNGTSALSRVRSTRASSTVSKPAQNGTNTGTSRGNAPAIASTTTTSHPTVSPTVSPTAPSHLSLFLGNLRLLDFDLHPEWPDINTHTFSTRDAAGGQKKRVQSVEWVLYHLFRIWDPEEARNKLQPFFPPLDQVQSLNLRAALLRGLEQAKKNGILGRDAVVRKTMLDECKGERLEEVLAVFSSAVLKKVVAEYQLNGGGYPALAQVLALENRGYSGERTELTALVLAHRVSLRRMLSEKNASRERFREFAGLLATKERAIKKKREAVEAAKRSEQGRVITDDQKRKVFSIVRNNWTGDERWMEALLYGDSKSNKDGLLNAPYDRVWRRVQSGRLAELEEASAGLLSQLNSRVRGQQERLQKWQGFRQRMFGKTGSQPATEEQEQNAKQRGIDLGFKAHETLHFDRMSPKKLPRALPDQLDSHYEALIAGLRSDLSKISPAVRAIPSFFERPRVERPTYRMEDHESGSEVISDISGHEQAQVVPRPSPSRREPVKVSEEPAFEPVLRKAKTFNEEHAFLDEEPVTPSRLQRSTTMQSHPSSANKRRQITDSPTRKPERRLSTTPRRRPRPPSPTRSPPRLTAAPSPEPPPSPERPISPTQDLADQILASVSAASPSPVKKPRHRLSLADRTRLTMARRTSHANLRVPADEDEDDEEDDEDQTPPSSSEDAGLEDDDEPRRAPITVPIVAEPLSIDGDEKVGGGGGGGGGGGERYEDLAARTRRSMAGYEAARQKAQLERRRSLRKANQPPSTPVAGRGGGGGGGGYFPAVDEEEGGVDTTLLLAEELLSGGQAGDYEAVFMSRPKLKNSPVGTPTREFWD